MPTSVLVAAIVAVLIFVPTAGGNFGATVLSVAAVLIANPIVRTIRKRRYFSSERFQTLKAEISSVVSDHNDIVQYVDEIRRSGSFELGSSSTGQHAHLASFENTSTWKYRRDRNVVEHAPHVHNASLQVVRNASTDPIKYLMKYFSIKPNQEALADVQRVSGDIARLEEAVANLQRREASITAAISPPAFILKHYKAEFWEQVGVHLSPVAVPYPRYSFQYVSAGGNSSQQTNIVLNTQTLDALSVTLAEKIRWSKSAAGQRALMTARLRTLIKERDAHTCRSCGISVSQEPHLLLEVDHVIPVSRGGLSVPENLQTLCWRCNRAKGAKLPT
ncbi:HNH endonuclease [Cellulomonas sp. P4]|uniref:HNH endonuclease n=1 Tax=Cellulomonas sp. P4 TaxID=3142533 RepID=UPI0031B9D8FB